MSLNIKIVDGNNWLKADPISAVLMTINTTTGIAEVMSGEDWVSIFSNVSLTNEVPECVRELFEVARGSLAYGYFFYPLCTLAFEQLFRVAEAAIAEKCKLLNAPKSKTKHFREKINYLIDERFISPTDFILWDSFREFRNLSSHPKKQNKYSIGMIAPVLGKVANEINKLFGNQGGLYD